jgi:hypothetical protein
MALSSMVIASFGGGAATVTLTYDDVSLLVTNVAAQNGSTDRTLRIDVTSPRVVSRVLAPGATLDLALVGVARMAYTMAPDYHGTLRPVGVMWSASYGF